MEQAQEPVDYGVAMMRGLALRCPHCGKGKLFARYLKQVDACAVCKESYAHIRSDDGPAWLTIVIVGHVLAAILLFVIPSSSWPDWLSMVVWLTFAVLLSLALLPPSKGLFIGILWRMGKGVPPTKTESE